MASINYFENASRPYRPDTPRLSHAASSSLAIETGGYKNKTAQGYQLAGYHGLGISGIHTPTPSVVETFLLPSPISDRDYQEAGFDQWKIPSAVDEELMTMAHDRSRNLRQSSRQQRQSNQALKEVMFAASDLASDDRLSRRSMVTPRSLSYGSSWSDSSVCRTPKETTESHDFWRICMKLRKMMAKGDREAERQRLLATPSCCESCGTPVTPVVFTPSRSFEVLGAWKEASMSP